VISLSAPVGMIRHFNDREDAATFNAATGRRESRSSRRRDTDRPDRHSEPILHLRPKAVQLPAEDLQPGFQITRFLGRAGRL
jgi:hypothetical protein